MKDLIDLLNKKERKVLRWLTLVTFAALLFCFFGTASRRGHYLQMKDQLSTKEKNYQKLQEERISKKKEWVRWKEAQDDINGLKKEYFYRGKRGINLLRIDLQKIFTTTGVRVSQIKYEYVGFKNEPITKVRVSFEVAGSYPTLKNFIHVVEEFQKFLVIEKIDFVDLKAQGSGLTLRMGLAGYYEI